jgi:peptidoglycan/LPS O-acetylase OafA/YrhL
MAHWLVKLLAFFDENLAVPVFIVLSGYLLMMPLAKGRPWQGAKLFIERRFRRLFPVYALMILACAVATIWIPQLGENGVMRWSGYAVPITSWDLVSHALMIQNWDPSSQLKIDPPMWSLSIEWQIYLVFALILVPMFLKRGVKGFGYTSAAICVPLYCLAPREAVLLCCFCLGALAVWYVHNKNPESSVWMTALVAQAALVLCVIPHPQFYTLRQFLAGSGCVAALVWLAGLSQDEKLVKWLSGDFCRWLGRISYSLYLIHYPILSLVHGLAKDAGVGKTPLALVIICVGLGLSLALSHLVSKHLEYVLVKPNPDRALSA